MSRGLSPDYTFLDTADLSRPKQLVDPDGPKGRRSRRFLGEERAGRAEGSVTVCTEAPPAGRMLVMSDRRLVPAWWNSDPEADAKPEGPVTREDESRCALT